MKIPKSTSNLGNPYGGNLYHGENRRQEKEEKENRESAEDAFELQLQAKIADKLNIEASIDEAIEAFCHEVATEKQGIRAEKQGSGPGLRILLTDSEGNLLRQISKEEFLQLREKASADATISRGKLLDRKA